MVESVGEAQEAVVYPVADHLRLVWHRPNFNGEVQMRKGLWWIPRHLETRKGVASDEMLRGGENKHRSRDSIMGQPFELLLNPWASKRQPGELKHLSS
ncbi:hypothetical protein AMTR_s00103p00141530 [Amborella trichopoda]|uniref:Uncharacterized protein n=1 Tax=Amborella trichopoda TaxID=13333 RepID=W1P1R7_AMBTC|nr:hypothetical protein AMTR_s00103p00141530 [Amborella trichopoda]